MIIATVFILLMIVWMTQGDRLKQLAAFNTNFYRIAGMVERARTFAIKTNKPYEVYIGLFNVFMGQPGYNPQESFEYPEMVFLDTVKFRSNCPSDARVIFEAGTGKETLKCGTTEVPSMQPQFCQMAPGATDCTSGTLLYTKSFTVRP